LSFRLDMLRTFDSKAGGRRPPLQSFLDLPQMSVIPAWLQQLKIMGVAPMRNRFRGAILAIIAAGAVSAFWLARTPVEGQQPAGQFAPYKAPRMADGHPDLNGIWQAFVTANWDIQDHDAQPGPYPELTGAYGAGGAGQSIVEGGEIPYQPSALAKKKEN